MRVQVLMRSRTSTPGTHTCSTVKTSSERCLSPIPWVIVLGLLVGQIPHSQAFSWIHPPVATRQDSSNVAKVRSFRPHLILAATTKRTTTTTTTTAAIPTISTRSASHKLTTSTRLWRQPNKWDFLDDEDEDDGDENFVGGKRQYTSCPPDMMYEPRIVQRAHQTFLAIRQAGGKEATNDVYVRDPIDRQVFWYTGKVARVSDVPLEECIHRLYPMIERHACHLRPLELYSHRGGNGILEVWTAPGDSELEVAYNRPSIQLQRFVHTKDWQYNSNNKKATKYPLHIKASMVGFQGEVYQDGEDGFRTWRNDDGLPARPEINPGGETRPPTLQELAQVQQELSTTTSTTSIGSSSKQVSVSSSTGSDNVGYIDAEFTNNEDNTSD